MERIVLPSEAASAGAARRFTQRVCGAAGVDADTVDIAVLLTSETVTNAVVHGRGDVRLAVTTDDGAVRVEAGDDDTRHPAPRTQVEGAIDGRGLVLLEAASSRWGVDDTPGGKIVWFELHVADRSLSAWPAPSRRRA